MGPLGISRMKYDILKAQVRSELAARSDVLKADVAAWTAEPRTTQMGLSPSQRVALVDMVSVLLERRENLLAKLDAATSPGAIADYQVEFVVETTGTNELWRVFRSILEQQEDPAFRSAVQAATRVAGDCYAHGIRKARLWKAIPMDRFREQPVVYLEAVDSPQTANRGAKAQSLSVSVREWRNLALPLPIALLPFDYVWSFWTYCALHHEAGHNLDQDLSLLSGLRAALLEVVPADQEPQWRKWSAEILADALGVTLGGAGFAWSLATDALMLGSAARYQTPDPDAVHPPFLVRVALVIAMLRLCDVPALAKCAEEIEEAWKEIPRASWMEPLCQAAPKVAELFLTQPLGALKDRRILDLNPALGAEHDLATALATFFSTGVKRPEPSGMPPRLVPAAAQLAIRQAAQVDVGLMTTLHKSAITYLALIPPGAVLAGGGGNRREYLKELTRRVRFPVQRLEEQ